jgi:hypothetical protein
MGIDIDIVLTCTAQVIFMLQPPTDKDESPCMSDFLELSLALSLKDTRLYHPNPCISISKRHAYRLKSYFCTIDGYGSVYIR